MTSRITYHVHTFIRTYLSTVPYFFFPSKMPFCTVANSSLWCWKSIHRATRLNSTGKKSISLKKQKCRNNIMVLRLLWRLYGYNDISEWLYHICCCCCLRCCYYYFEFIFSFSLSYFSRCDTNSTPAKTLRHLFVSII